jgi:hypothetical protein
MPSLKELIHGQCTLKVPYGKTTITVVYRPSYYTPAVEAEIREKERVSEILWAQLCAALASWDLTTDDGKAPIPFTPEALEEYDLPIVLLDTIITAIRDDNTVGKARKKNS